MRIAIINGPNLNMLGTREPDKYGSSPFETYYEGLKVAYDDVEFVYYQSNVEGELINAIQKFGFDCNGILLNAGGYTHTSVAIADAVAAVKIPVVEVHITNILAREEYRHVSLIAKNCVGTISGFGLDGYRLGVEAIVNKNN